MLLCVCAVATAATSARLDAQRTDTSHVTARLRLRIGRDTLPLQLPSVQTDADLRAYREAEAQISAARATAFQLNSRSVFEAAWGQITAQNFAAQGRRPLDAESAQPRQARKTAPPLFGQGSDLGIQLDSRLEFRNEKDATNACAGLSYYLSTNTCSSSFQPTLDFQYALRSGGVVADRVHVNVDYDSQREFDASNTISISYEGKPQETVQKVEVGNVTFQPPPSRFITAAIPSGNYGIQAVTQLGPVRVTAIAAQQKGNVVRDRTFTVGTQVLQAVDRTVEDYQFEPRRFFFTVDPKLFAGYPNVDILNRAQMAKLAAALPDTLRPARLYVYRLIIGGQPPNPNGPQFKIIGDPTSRRGQVYEYLREGIDYYADPSRLWIALVRPLSLSNERLVVAYKVRVGGVETIHVTTGGTPDLEFDPSHDQYANLLWDPTTQPSDPTFDREIRSVYRLGGSDLVRQSVSVKVVTGNATDQEKPLAGSAETYLKLFGLAQATNTSTFDVENRVWPRPTDPDFALGVGVFGTQIIRDQFLVFPSVRPFASNGIAGTANPHNDTLYTTPAQYLISSQRPGAVYHIRLHYEAQGNGDNGTLALGSVQVRPNSERILVDNVQLSRGTDYTVDYDLGRVNFARPDTLFSRPRQVTVQYEENPLFIETPTSIFGTALEIPLANGQIDFIALSQTQHSSYTRPPLGLEPQSTLIGGVSTELHFDAEPLTRLISRMPYGSTSVPSHVTLAAEFAASKPEPSAGQEAYLESFEGAGGIAVRLADQYWYLSSQPAAGRTLLPRIGATSLDLNRAAQIAYQTNVRDARGAQIRFTIDQIDTLSTLVGAGIAPPEELLWMTLFPLRVGVQDEPGSQAHWDTRDNLPGRRWRSIRTPLGPAGTDVSHTENIEFWALVNTGQNTRLNPTLVFDVGVVSENSVQLQPDTIIFRNTSKTSRDTLMYGRRLAGVDSLASERDPFSRAFNAGVNDTGLPGDVALNPFVIADTIPGQPERIGVVPKVTICRNHIGALYTIGDSRADCTAGNGRLDEEDIDGDNVLNLTSAQRDQEQFRRYVVDLSDTTRYTRTGKCYPATNYDRNAEAGDNVCWVFIRVPFRAPDDSLNSPNLRIARALRITMVSSPLLPDSAFSQIALDELNFSGSPWLKRADATLRGVAGATSSSGFVTLATIGTQDKNVRGSESYVSPPGVAQVPDLKTTQLTPQRVLVNEHSLRITAGDLNLFDRAEAYYRFPEGEKNFLGYRQLRVWGKGVGNGWGLNGDLDFYVKIATDANNFYMYHAPLNGAVGVGGWLDVTVDFSKIIALRAQVQNAYLHGTTRNTCTGIDSALVVTTPVQMSTSTSALYAACSEGYIVYTTDPGVNPPNLAAVQELDVGMVRTGLSNGSRPISPSDTLELWVDDIRLGGVVATTGFAGQVALGVTASDFGELHVNLMRKDPNFRQLGDQPSYLTDNNIDIGAAFRLEKFLPRSFGYAIPVTVSYSGASSDPYYLTQSDIDASAVPGLRTPRDVATSITLGIRRATPLTGGTLAPLLNNLALTSAYTTGESRSEYEDGHAHDFRLGVEYNLLRAIAPSVATVLPTELYLTSTYENGDDKRLTYLLPAASPNDPPTIVGGITNTLNNGAAIAFHPLRNASIRFNLTSIRDLRSYNNDPTLGLIDISERDRIAGLDAGLERERDVGTQVSYSITPLPWLRARANTNSSYNMLRDPNTLSFVTALDSTGPLRIPRKIGNTQNANFGLTVDFKSLAAHGAPPIPGLRALLGAMQPLDISLDRNVLTEYDAGALSAPISYQLGFGGIGSFSHIGDEAATSAGVNTQLGISHSINLPFGAVLTNRYQRVTLRNWTLNADNTEDVGDATQVVFPDVGLRWTRKIEAPGSPLTNFSATARIVGTRQILSSPGEFDLPDGDNGETRIRSYPLSLTAVWIGSRPLTTTFGANLVQRLNNQPGLSGRANSLDFNADVARAFGLPAQWHPRSDLRARLSYQNSQGESYVLNPLAIGCTTTYGCRSRLTDNGRRSVTFTTDTDVADNVTSSFVVSRVNSFDANLNRVFTQTILSAVLHLQFFSGEMH